jgi:hypothetical protein
LQIGFDSENYLEIGWWVSLPRARSDVENFH